MTKYRYAAVFMFVSVLVATSVTPADASSITTRKWAGRAWEVRPPSDRTGPAVNQAYLRRNVVVDDDGRLHLKISRSSSGSLASAQIDSVKRGWGYGTFRFVLDSSIREFPSQVVLGMFVHDRNRKTGYSEIDVEAASWGGSTPFWDHTFFPKPIPGRPHVVNSRYTAPSGPSVHEIVWAPKSITWRTSYADGTVYRTRVNQRIPRPNRERVAINFWVFGGGTEQWRSTPAMEVVLSSFEFVPRGESA